MTRRFALGVLAIDRRPRPGGVRQRRRRLGRTKTATNGAITIDAHDVHFDIGTIEASPGPLTVTLKNKGAIQHTFKILGTDLRAEGERRQGRRPAPSPSKKGTYDFECTIPGHAAQGMKGKVVVS